MNFLNVCGLLCKCSSWSTFVIKMCVAIRRWSKKSVEYFTSLSFQHLATVPVSQGFIVGMLSDHILSNWRYKRVAFKPKHNRCLSFTIFHNSKRFYLPPLYPTIFIKLFINYNITSSNKTKEFAIPTNLMPLCKGLKCTIECTMQNLSHSTCDLSWYWRTVGQVSKYNTALQLSIFIHRQFHHRNSLIVTVLHLD